MNIRQQFLQTLAPTSFEPMALHITKAEGCFLYDNNQKSYIDLIGGISVGNVGHSHPEVVAAVQQQAATYMHIMVYGEVIQTPQVSYATKLTKLLAPNLNSVYFTNSGAEAVEGAMKLAKRVTQRTEIIACHHSYHGSTQGALSIFGDEYWRNAYRPLLPDIRHIRYNNLEDLPLITQRTAAIFIEPIQAEGGIIIPTDEWLQALQARCNATGTLLILDEIQTGFGRTGKLFAHQLLNITPDVLLLGKALGGGMPLGAFITSKKMMDCLAAKPILGHLTTFGGHPVSCAAGLAALEVLLEEKLIDEVEEKAALFVNLLQHPLILKVNQKGLMMAVHLPDFDTVQKTIKGLLNAEQAVFTDWFLFASNAIRIVPPLTITLTEIEMACRTILKVLEEIHQSN